MSEKEKELTITEETKTEEQKQPPLEGEVIGYELNDVLRTIFDELALARQKKVLSPKTAYICKEIIGQWGSTTVQQGGTIINLPKDI